MKIIDHHDELKERFVNLPEGNIFKLNNQYYMKIMAMFLYSDIDDLLERDNVYDITEIESECNIVNAICLNEFAVHYHINDDTLVEPLKTELHIV